MFSYPAAGKGRPAKSFSTCGGMSFCGFYLAILSYTRSLKAFPRQRALTSKLAIFSWSRSVILNFFSAMDFVALRPSMVALDEDLCISQKPLDPIISISFYFHVLVVLISGMQTTACLSIVSCGLTLYLMSPMHRVTGAPFFISSSKSWISSGMKLIRSSCYIKPALAILSSSSLSPPFTGL